MPLRVYCRYLGAIAALVFSLVCSLVPAAVAGQGGTGADSLAFPGVRIPRSWAPAVPWVLPPAFTPFARAVLRDEPSREIAAAEAAAMSKWLVARQWERWNRAVVRAREIGVVGEAVFASASSDTLGVQRPDSGLAALLGDFLSDNSSLGMEMHATLESKLERSRNERCTASQYFSVTSQCNSGFQPAFDLQFDIRTGGSIADRLFVNVDYNTKNEFRSSDNINIFYKGKSDEFLQRLEVGNVSFQPPPSQFITNGIPQGNYGFQAIGQLGPMLFRGIVAQQQGNVPKSYDVVVGDRTVKPDNRELEDYQVDARRFFFTVDPLLFVNAYPNIDLLNGVQMRALAEALPETSRPRRLFVYRLLLGGQPVNPNGPRFQIIGDPNSRPGPIYELLQENKDYYTDPSLLWIALQRELNPQNERLVIAYTLRIGGRDTVIADLGGTPDVSNVTDRPQLAHLLWDPQVRPGDATFRQEIRSIYKVAGEDLQRRSVSVRIVAGSGAGQEKPVAGVADTYLQMFGLSQSGNSSLFDVDNRLWPRPADPNVAIIGSANPKIINDFYLVLPSVRPFARDGLVQAGNPASDTIYVTPGEDLYSQQHPPSQYRLQLRYDVAGGGSVGTLNISAVQLRKSSENVQVDGITLVRDKDYTIDYDIGLITFTRPDTLFPRPRRVSVRYEENPLFAAAPTSILGFAGQVPLERGEFGLTVISQRQTTSFTRPPLGYEPQGSFIAGLTGRMSFEAAPLSRLLEKLPTIESTTLSHIDLQTEFATSRPQSNSAGAAYVVTFEEASGFSLPMQEAAWYYSSQPALGVRLPQRLGAETFSLLRASTMAWQGSGLTRAGIPLQFTLPQIDPQATLSGTGVNAPEPMLWLTLYPLNVGGLMSDRTGQFQWRVADTPAGKRWRSVRAGLGPSGADMSRVEYMTFWTLADTSYAKRHANPTLILDLGDPSENSAVFGPTALTLTTGAGGVIDSAYSGKAFMGLDVLNSERDSLTRSFNAAINDTGLPGDVVPIMNVFHNDGSFESITNFTTCSRGAFQILLVGDARNNCTVRNGRLDEEDIDGDNVLNLVEAQRESERLRRYIVDLANPANYSRIGKCSVAAFDTTAGGLVTATDLCWVQVKVPFGAPDDSLNGGPNIRRIRAIRLTVVSGEAAADTGFTTLPIALFKFQGSPLVKRSQRTVRGIAGDDAAQGFVIASVIGTEDRDSLRRIDYESPPGVTDAPEKQQTGLENVRTQINEHSMRLLAGRVQPFERAEAFLRFPEGAKNFMNYRALRVWARGRGNGWGQGGELQFYIKIGRDANNFYLYRTDVSAGTGSAAWLPEVRVDFGRLFALQAQMQNSVNRAGADSISCTGVDSVLIAHSGLPLGQPINRHAVCSGGYIVYSVDPAVSPPNLAQVQELAVGMVRLSDGGGPSPIMLADTLELWVDDIRLTDVDNTPGYAGQIALNVQAGDIANFRFNVSRRDANFRQLAEQPSYLANDGVDLFSSFRLERLIPGAAGFALPFTISHTSGSSQPLFLSQSDILGAGIANLRTPRTQATRYSISMRRVAPLTGTAWGVLVNNLTANANLQRASSRSEFSDGGSSAWNAGLDYNLQANPRFTLLPRWLQRGSAEHARVRWNPTQVRFSTDIGHMSDSRQSFNKAVAISSDTGRRVTGLNYVLRSQSAVEFRPVQALTARWDFTTVRDLRNYGDTTATSIVASREREKLAGVGIGLERERTMNASMSFSPDVVTYFRPSVTLTSAYTMQRDPQTRQLVRSDDSTGAFRLPRRLFNMQSIAATSMFDPARALRTWFGEGGRGARLASLFQQLDLQYSRSLSSSYDGAPFDPGLGYQFALAGIDGYRETKNHRATIASMTDQITLSTGFLLRKDLVLTSRGQLVHTDNYTRRLDNTQALIQGKQQTLPELRLQWTDSLAWLKNWEPFGKDKGHPLGWLRAITSLTMNAGVIATRRETFVAAETPDAASDLRVDDSQRYPIHATISWNDVGGLLTNVQYDKQHGTSSYTGSITETQTRDMSADLSRSFAMPSRWGLRSKLRTRVGWQHSTSSSYITVENATRPSRLTDNGRTAVNLNTDTDVATNLRFSLNGSHVTMYDNNFNRRVTQFVLTVVFTLYYGAGSWK